MADDATKWQIDNRKKVVFGAVVVFLIIVIIALVGAIIKNLTPEHNFERESAAISVEQGNKERAAFPIIKHLPIKNSLYTLGYQFDAESQKLTIKLKTTAANFDIAIKKLMSFGEDLTTSALEITAPENPFLSAYVINDLTDLTDALKAAYAKVPNFNVLKVETVDWPSEPSSDDADDSGPIRYALAVFSTGRADHYSLQTYRLILKFENQTWLPVANPAPILNQYNMPGVPTDLLLRANQL